MTERFFIHDSLDGWWEVRDSDKHVDLVKLRDRAQAFQVCGLLNNLQHEWEQKKAMAMAGGAK